MTAFADTLRLVRLAAVTLGGRRWGLVPLVPLLWPLLQILRLLVGWETEAYQPADAQNGLIGAPLAILAIGLGVRIIASEVERRTLEVGYTVPGGIRRLFLAKLAAATGMLVVAELLLAAVAFVFLTDVPPLALYGALQAALFYLVVGMAWAALFRSEVTGALASAATLFLNALITGFGEEQVRFSAFWNEAALSTAAREDLLAWSVQNRIGFALAIVAVAALGFARAERREKMLA